MRARDRDRQTDTERETKGQTETNIKKGKHRKTDSECDRKKDVKEHNSKSFFSQNKGEKVEGQTGHRVNGIPLENLGFQ